MLPVSKEDFGNLLSSYSVQVDLRHFPAGSVHLGQYKLFHKRLRSATKCSLTAERIQQLEVGIRLVYRADQTERRLGGSVDSVGNSTKREKNGVKSNLHGHSLKRRYYHYFSSISILS
jgi:hypothetical protein